MTPSVNHKQRTSDTVGPFRPWGISEPKERTHYLRQQVRIVYRSLQTPGPETRPGPLFCGLKPPLRRGNEVGYLRPLPLVVCGVNEGPGFTDRVVPEGSSVSNLPSFGPSPPSRPTWGSDRGSPGGNRR